MLGIVVSSAQIGIWLLYFTIELYAGAKHFQGRSAPALLAFLIIFGVVGYIIIPGWVLFRELAASTNDTSTSDSHELLMEANNSENKPFLSQLALESLEDGTYAQRKRESFRNPIIRTNNHHHHPRNSDSSLEQMLHLSKGGGGVHSNSYSKRAVSPEIDDSSTASTRSFLRSLGSGGGGGKGGSDSSTDLQLFRARAASAFLPGGGGGSNKSGGGGAGGGGDDSSASSLMNSMLTPLYADMMPADRKMSNAQRELLTPGSTGGSGSRRPSSAVPFVSGEKKVDDDDDEEDDGDDLNTRITFSSPPPKFASLANRDRTPTRIRSPTDAAGDSSVGNSNNLGGDGKVSAFTAGEGAMVIPRPISISNNETTGSYLRKRSVAPLKPRVSGTVVTLNTEGAGALTTGMTQVAAATAALDPNKILPMLMKLGVSSVEAAGMMTYLMRMKELSDGRKRKNSLAMVV